MNKIDSLLSLASRARKLISGAEMVEKDIKSLKRKTKLIILAEDAKDTVKEIIKYNAEKYNVDLIEYATKKDLGHYIGKAERSVIGITDESFKDGIIKCRKGSD